MKTEKNKVYYMDGYHGGIRGHMPLGAWRDILDQMKKHPEWRLSIDVEAISWNYLKERDPEAYEEFVAFINNDSDDGRMEMVSGSYGQPYAWITDGESNIRHLVMGREEIGKHFPDVTIDSYVVQEPCWTSAMPQILRQLGYQRASLKNASTAWGGYSEGYPAEVVDWTGPDGTSIPTIPRYSCEELVNVYSTEAKDSTTEYVEKCVKEGILHPTGMYYQDLGWGARPAMSNENGVTPDYVEYSTPRDYFNHVTDTERPHWQPGQEIFCGALPWGNQVLVRTARQVRRCEREMLDAERLHAVASLLGMKKQEERLKEAWSHLLMTQHHDGWICVSVGEWEEKASAQVYAAEFIFDKTNREAMSCITGSLDSKRTEGCETITVFNPLAKAEKRLVRVDMTGKLGTRGFEVYDGEKKVPCQPIEGRRHKDGSWNAGELLFLAELPAIGYKTFTLRALKEETREEAQIKAELQGQMIVLENQYMSVRINPNKGGTIESYYDKIRNQELVPQGEAFNEFKGYFIKEERFCSNTEHPAEAKIEWKGTLEAMVSLRGKIADSSYVLSYTLQAASPRLDVQVTFEFQKDTMIGEPYDMIQGPDVHDPHRTYHDGRYRLNAYFPTVFAQKYLDKDCAYDVCRSKLENTHFKSWYEIKHNILVHWADTSDDNQGFCVFCDHTTGYIHGEDVPFGLALAWGYEGGYWWGRQTLEGSHQLRYQLMAHEGGWQAANLWHECEDFLHQPIGRRSSYVEQQNINSIFEIQTDGIELGSFYCEKGEYFVRVFNAGKNNEAVFKLNSEYFTKMEETSPDGISSGHFLKCQEGCSELFRDTMPPFGIRTYRLTK